MLASVNCFMKLFSQIDWLLWFKLFQLHNVTVSSLNSHLQQRCWLIMDCTTQVRFGSVPNFNSILLNSKLPFPLSVHIQSFILAASYLSYCLKRKRKPFSCWIRTLINCQQWIFDGVSNSTWPCEWWLVEQLEKQCAKHLYFRGICKCLGNGMDIKYSITRWQYLQVF